MPKCNNCQQEVKKIIGVNADCKDCRHQARRQNRQEAIKGKTKIKTTILPLTLWEGRG